MSNKGFCEMIVAICFVYNVFGIDCLEMDGVQFSVAFLCIGCILGVVVLWTYFLFGRAYYGYSEHEQNLIWGFFGYPLYWSIWCVSALVSAIAFLLFSIWIFQNYTFVANNNATWVLYPYALFLSLSAIYTPLIMCKVPKLIVILDLLCVACSAIALSAWTFTFMRRSDPMQVFLMFGVFILALHCTVVDLVLWGYDWYNGYFWTIENSTGKYERASTDKSASSAYFPEGSQFNESASPWPSISSYDIISPKHPQCPLRHHLLV